MAERGCSSSGGRPGRVGGARLGTPLRLTRLAQLRQARTDQVERVELGEAGREQVAVRLRDRVEVASEEDHRQVPFKRTSQVGAVAVRQMIVREHDIEDGAPVGDEPQRRAHVRRARDRAPQRTQLPRDNAQQDVPVVDQENPRHLFPISSGGGRQWGRIYPLSTFGERPVAVPVTILSDGPAMAAATRTTTRLLLLVEDNDLLRRTMSRALLAYGYEVHPAAAVTEAVELARRTVFDVVLSDYHLPDGTGADVVTQVRRTQALLRFCSRRSRAPYRSRSRRSFRRCSPSPHRW